MAVLSILPHYEINDDHLLFLKREKLYINATECEILKRIEKKDGINESEMNTIGRLLNDKILIELPVVKDAMVKKKSKIIFAAHSDDAALSLGGQLLLQTDKFKIITVFNTCPISFSLKDYDLSATEVTTYNNYEEEFYASSVNASLLFLDYKEALDRKYSFEEIFEGKILPKDNDLFNELKRQIFSILETHTCDGCEFYFPLAIGNHVDHVILFQIGSELLHKFNFPIKFYEDLPYALGEIQNIPEWVKVNRNIISSPMEIDITDVVDKKEEMISIYRTQYSSMDLPEIARYAKTIGRTRAIERLW